MAKANKDISIKVAKLLQKKEHKNEAFLKEVKDLDLRFPVATISAGTGYSKGTVSRYLNDGQPSGKFIKKLENWIIENNLKVSKVGESGNNIETNSTKSSDREEATVIKLLYNQIEQMSAHIETLKNENSFLKMLLANEKDK